MKYAGRNFKNLVGTIKHMKGRYVSRHVIISRDMQFFKIYLDDNLINPRWGTGEEEEGW